MPSFQIDHLATLVAVLDEGTFDAAARRLHITPSAVSQRIKAMEQTAGQVLVTRANPARATAAGASVAGYARQVALLAQDLSIGLDEDTAGGSMAVAVNSDSLATWFLPVLADAHAALGVAFDVLREDQDHTAELLRSGAVLAAVTATGSPVQGCVSSPLGSMRYRAVATPRFVARWLDPGDLGRIGSAPMVDFDRSDGLQHAFVRGVTGSDARGPRHYIPASSDFARAVQLGLGWGMLPEFQCADALRDGSLVDLAPERSIDVALHWQRWNLRSTTLDGLTAIVLETAATQLRH